MDRFKLRGIYKHFKGDRYILEDVVYDSETTGKMIVYRALYGDGRAWVRPYDDFFSEIDHAKYPNVTQKYRFELEEPESVA